MEESVVWCISYSKDEIFRVFFTMMLWISKIYCGRKMWWKSSLVSMSFIFLSFTPFFVQCLEKILFAVYCIFYVFRKPCLWWWCDVEEPFTDDKFIMSVAKVVLLRALQLYIYSLLAKKKKKSISWETSITVYFKNCMQMETSLFSPLNCRYDTHTHYHKCL